jgi:hypothetical protein
MFCAWLLRMLPILYRVIRNDCQGFNNLSYTIHLKQAYVVAQMDQEILSFLLWCAPPHFHRRVREFLKQHLPQRWIGRGTDDDQILFVWPPRSPEATPCDFFLWGYVQVQVYAPPLPASISELKVRIRTAIDTITADMLQTVWNELDYHVDVCRITKGAHIEHL